ncbi:outer membrane lipoprotein carrier protein LolA [Reichenbachiella carrageenanivorans]|uniref:Outer membrane lipoprotein carrier protein LolA n=1 Tax=Reichenbachiella carrageenanivorans TaxID=2979869 RepID=A0ABY6D0N3_9BACT|nr:outer membrane lipoprotein carrier protein LolA [Reichenbachiella carrageenanivorans]UXX79717.1 outer membrane lipoprotein carrier protein LolA [Reichenbachiella carrageenanivorans]
MKSIQFLFILSIAVLSQAIAQKDPAAKEILDAMSAKYQKIPAFRAEFSYTMEDEGDEIDEGFRGTILVKGNKYMLIMDEQQVTFDGTSIYTYLKEENEMTIASYDPEEEEISLSNIFNIYKTGFKYVYTESRNNGSIDVIDLVPEDREKDYFKIRMEISTTDQSLKSFKVFDKSGSRYLYKVLSFKEDASITDQTFAYDKSKYVGTEVIDFR